MGGSDLGGDLSCQIFHADKNLADEQNRENDPHFAALLPGCAAAALTQQVKLSLGSTQRRCTIWEVSCDVVGGGVGAECIKVFARGWRRI